MRVTQITSQNPAAPSGQDALLDYQYDYDRMDNIILKSTGHGDYAYGYDPLYRLTAADHPTGTGACG